MNAPAPSKAPDTVDRVKRACIQHMDGPVARRGYLPYEGNLHHDYFRRLPFFALRELVSDCGLSLNDGTVLVAGCGTGTDVHHLRKFYDPQFVVMDISAPAVRQTVDRHAGVFGAAADMEQLPFPTNSIDWSFVAASLHHLPRPLLGLYELLRVARRGLILIEPHDSALCRLATRLGLATEVEEVGNYVYRLNAHDIERLAKSLFYSTRCRSLFAIHRVARTAAEFALLRVLNAAANLLLRPQGNCLVGIILKSRSNSR